jgi:TolA-binding protein
MLSIKQTEAGEKELRLLIQRYPNTPEATVAHNRLNAISKARE